LSGAGISKIIKNSNRPLPSPTNLFFSMPYIIRIHK
jgi:hypothetical protein